MSASSEPCGEGTRGRLQVAFARARLPASVGSAHTLCRPCTGPQSSEAKNSHPNISPTPRGVVAGGCSASDARTMTVKRRHRKKERARERASKRA
jgi:hypothetical protein